MAYTYPLALTVLADLLPIAAVTWDIQRNDELSGSGDGRVWQAELAPPLWTADVVLDKGTRSELKPIAAIVRKLYGAQESFWLYDPLSRYPKMDPTGAIVGASNVRVGAVGAQRKSISLTGLPAGYVLSIADKLQIAYASTLSFFCEVSENVTAGGGGTTAEFEVFPHVPIGLIANDVVTVKQPACKMFVLTNSFKPGTARGALIYDAGFRVMERRR